MEVMCNMWGMPFMMFGGFLFSILVLVALGLAIWWLIRQLRPGSRDAALAALRERYARGEITREEFEARRHDLAA
ncbi:MAG TPA: SHOCT domain-containing protein [Methylomirabilota bacterium]|jgi:putative membrane protein|nr:SHOCT domain-containing protein [Methylomirabilota bacterium]